MRQFTLKNSIGEVYRLNSLEYFFHDPEGLGYSRNTVFRKIGTRYEILKDEFAQTPIRGQIMLKSSSSISAYNRYLKFTRFLQEIPLTLIYRIPGGEFLLTCIPGTVEKTEINSALGMDIGIELVPLSMWYKEIRKTSSTGIVELTSDSLIESPCHIMFTPSSSVTGTLSWKRDMIENSSVVETLTGSLTNITLTGPDVLHIRTDTNPYEIMKNRSTELYSKSDFSTKRFVFLKKGLNRITFHQSGTIIAGDVVVEGRILYETV